MWNRAVIFSIGIRFKPCGQLPDRIEVRLLADSDIGADVKLCEKPCCCGLPPEWFSRHRVLQMRKPQGAARLPCQQDRRQERSTPETLWLPAANVTLLTTSSRHVA